jgi:hypothetical protein
MSQCAVDASKPQEPIIEDTEIASHAESWTSLIHFQMTLLDGVV